MNKNTKLFHDILEEIKQELEGNFRIEVSDEEKKNLADLMSALNL